MLALLLGVAVALNADLSADAVSAAQANSATKPHPGITTVNLVPTQRRHLLALAQQESSTVVTRNMHPRGTTTVSLIPTHDKQRAHQESFLQEPIQTAPVETPKSLLRATKKEDQSPAAEDATKGLPTKDAKDGLPSQGYSGKSVAHPDMETMTADWHSEYTKPTPPKSAAALGAMLAVAALFA